jgi:predicted flavoprotein YhiN
MASVAIIGGGASGLAAGIWAAREGAAVTIYEGKDRPGKKLLATGNGKCNLGNMQMSSEFYYGGSKDWLKECLNRFSVEDTIRFFESLGLYVKEKNGYLYPMCSQAAVVLEVLREELKELGVQILTGYKVQSIRHIQSKSQEVESSISQKQNLSQAALDNQNRMKRQESTGFLEHSEQLKKSSHLGNIEFQKKIIRQEVCSNEFEICVWDESRQKQLCTTYDRVILACGGKAAPKTGSDGNGYTLAESLSHRIMPVFPALTPLYCKDPICKQLAGVRAEGRIRIWDQDECIAQESGEIQFTEYGLSGIPIFQVSRIVNQRLLKKSELQPADKVDIRSSSKTQRKLGLQATTAAKYGAELLCTVDFMEQWEAGQEEELLAKRLLLLGDRSVEAFFTGILHQKIMRAMCRMAGLELNAQVKQQDRKKLLKVLQYCRRLPFHIVGSGSFEQAQVSAGGVDISQVSTDMESKLIPGLYFAGEILDVDGACGGYNLQWAWTSGYLAGIHAARRVRTTTTENHII